MAIPPKKTNTTVARPLPNEIVEVAQLIQSGRLTSWTIERSSNGATKFNGFDDDGHGILIERRDVGHYSRSVTETFTKASSIDERRHIVAELRREGYTQSQIAIRTGFSQKTISNDCAALGL